MNLMKSRSRYDYPTLFDAPLRTNNGVRWGATFATAKAGLLEWDGNREGRKLGQFDARFGWNSNHSYY
jgi:hypothetical protein